MTTEEIMFPELPHYLSVKKVTDLENNNVKVVVESTIHVNPVIEMPTSFSIDFVQSRPGQFKADVLSFVVRRYGLKLEPARYS